MGLWFVLWLLFVLFLLVLPLGYGWGYRGWGPPYPSYYRTRRGTVAVDPAADPAADPAVEEASAWGALDDLLWVVVIVAFVWLLVGLLV